MKEIVACLWAEESRRSSLTVQKGRKTWQLMVQDACRFSCSSTAFMPSACGTVHSPRRRASNCLLPLPQIVPLTTSHRLDDSLAEQKRVQEAGSEVSQSAIDGKPVGPLRVWPGGLAMARTIGDLEAGEAVTAEPDVWQVEPCPCSLAPVCRTSPAFCASTHNLVFCSSRVLNPPPSSPDRESPCSKISSCTVPTTCSNPDSD